MSFIAHLCSHFEDDLNYISPFDKIYRRCSVCQDDFNTPFQTLLHKDQAHMHEMQEFRCRICQQNHQTLMDLFTHLNYTHGALDMPYHCDRCGYRTSMYEDMAHHIRQVIDTTEYSSLNRSFCSDAQEHTIFLLSVLLSIGPTTIDILHEYS